MLQSQSHRSSSHAHAPQSHENKGAHHAAPAPHAAHPAQSGDIRRAAAHSAQAPVQAPKAPLATSFDVLGLEAHLLANLAAEGYTVPTPIQAQAIPPLLSGRDVLGCAQTGTGKTAAFALPILQRLITDTVQHAAHIAPTAHPEARPAQNGQGQGRNQRPGRFPRALILSPTRELATQIAQSFATYGRGTGLRGTVVFGGVGQNPQVRALQNGVDVLIATPGRLMDLMEQGLVNLSQVSMFVLDEADRMLDMGFIQPIRRIVSALPKTTPRQTLLFSATMPREIMHLADSLLHNPVKVTVTPVASTVALIEQKLYHVSRNDKLPLLGHILESQNVTRAVVFTKTKHGADKLCRKLHVAGISSTAIHGNKGQNQRDRALDAFKAGKVRVLVATDVAARGLDVDGITHVFNFDLPMEPEGYVHRIGRTGRAGASGIAVSMCDPSERDLLRDIERLTGKKIPTAPAPTNLPQLKIVAPEMTDTHPSADRPYGGSSQHRSSHSGGHSGGYGGGGAGGQSRSRGGWQSSGRGRRGPQRGR